MNPFILFSDLALTLSLIFMLHAAPHLPGEGVPPEEALQQIPHDDPHRHRHPPPSTGIIISPTPPPEIPVPVKLAAQSIEVRIVDNAATVRVTQTFKNSCGRRLEGMYLFPLPEQSTISDFAMFDGETRLTGRILPKEEARSIYEEIVRKQRDPALLEYMGQGVFQVRIFPIEPFAEKKLELTYTRILRPVNFSCRFDCNVIPDKVVTADADIRIHASIRSSAALSNIYSPTHELKITHTGEKEAAVSASGRRDVRDFILYYTTGAQAIGANLIPFRPVADEDGFFLLTLSPSFASENAPPVPKDVIFVLDRSGSMSGEKIRQAREALKYCLRNLRPGDRFGVIDFSDDVEVMNASFAAADAGAIDDAVYRIDRINAGGGTNIDEALRRAFALKSARDGRPTALIFLTDGLPTLGEQNPAAILRNAGERNRCGARLFCFGVGYDVDTHLLDKLGEQNGGASNYVSPDEDIETEVSRFFTKINRPVLTDCSLDWSGFRARDLYPQKLPDIFQGSQLILLGRYEKGDKVSVRLSGLAGDRRQSYEYHLTFPEKERENEFVAGLWARRKVSYLLDAVRLNGENKELVDEIVRLSRTYGIVNEYTSFIITEKEEIARERIGGAFERRRYDMATGYQPVAPKAAESMVQASKMMRGMKDASVVESRDRTAEWRFASGKIFLMKKGVWTDAAYDESKALKKIALPFGSDEYFSFIAKHPELLDAFQLGDNLLLVAGRECYVVSPS